MNIIGIKLGLTYCSVAKIYDLGKLEIVPFGSGERLLPSCVYIEGNNIYVGKEARIYGEGNPNNYFALIHKYLGYDFFPKVDYDKQPIKGKIRIINSATVSSHIYNH